ncbi:MAG: hypothetical protein KA105_00325 [Caulobacter sp.]|nr:hypothetical protein [Caulobacter sp.]
MAAEILQARRFGGAPALRPAGLFSRLIAPRLVLIMAIVFAFGFIACGTSAHAALDAIEGATLASSTAQATTMAAPKAPDQPAPMKKTLDLCTGHCMAHVLSLPAAVVEQATPMTHATVWRLRQDHLLLGDRTVILDRPPRA